MKNISVCTVYEIIKDSSKSLHTVIRRRGFLPGHRYRNVTVEWFLARIGLAPPFVNDGVHPEFRGLEDAEECGKNRLVSCLQVRFTCLRNLLHTRYCNRHKRDQFCSETDEKVQTVAEQVFLG